MNASNSETTSLTEKMLMTEKMVTEKESTEFGRKRKDESHIHYRSNN
jgi:hypothetical protein